jgi:transcriptional regulator with XRE-family HTH domain
MAVGWSQLELADRARTSQTKIWRLETNQPGGADVETLDRVLVELGLRVTLEIDGPHVHERFEQRDPVHAALVGCLAARLRRLGWEREAPWAARRQG